MSKHIIIIGGGVIGRCTAYYAAKRGHRVTLLERHAADHWGCSFGNAGFITPSHFVPLAAPGMVAMGLKWMLSPESPFYLKPSLRPGLISWGWKYYRASTRSHVARSAPLLAALNFASRACFEDLAELSNNEFGLVKKGILMLCNSEEHLNKEKGLVPEANRLGLAADVLTADEVRKLETGVRLNIVGAIHYPDDCHLIPDRFMALLNRLLEESDVQCRWGTSVSGWKVNGGRIEALQTPDGEVRGDEYVVCLGSWSQSLLRTFKVRMPMQAGKGYSLTIPRPRNLPTMPAICTEARLAVTPLNGSLRFGGTMEITDVNEEINPARIRGIMKSAVRYYPEFSMDDFKGIEPWCGLRPLSPDGLPYVGRVKPYANLSVGTGHAMMGLSLGPITGKLLAQILSDDVPDIDIAQLSPTRYN